jgi:HEAT repeat protein
MFEGITTEDAQAELLRMGEDAIPALIGALRDPKNGWTAAMVLSRIGIPSVEAVDALREMAAGGHWYSTALGSLGDHKWLATQPPDVAVHGLVAPFLAIASEGGAAPEFDYHPLEAFLTIQGDVASKLVESALKPGQSYRKLTASDVPEAVRGLTSKHAVIRWHACASLGNRSLGARCEKSILPALAVCLEDEHHLVRRLCALAIGRWKTAAQPYVQKLQVMLTEDDNEVVRNIVKHALSNIG